MSAFLNFVTGEWYFAVPMFLMSFVAIALIVWRILLKKPPSRIGLLVLCLPAETSKSVESSGPRQGRISTSFRKGIPWSSWS